MCVCVSVCVCVCVCECGTPHGMCLGEERELDK